MKFVLQDEAACDRLIRYVREQQKPVQAEIKPYRDSRSNVQNRKMWAMLEDIANQVEYHGQYYTEEDWKDIITASLKSELRMAPTTDGQRIVILGLRTSKMTMQKMAELIEFMYSFGAEKGVRWSDPADILNSEDA